MKFIDKWKLILITYQSALKEVSMYGSSQVIIQACSFIGMTFVAKYLGPTNLGLYSFVQSYLSTSLVIISGFDFFYSWQLASSSDKHDVVKNYLLQKLSVMAVVLTPAIIGGFIFLPKDVYLLSLASFAPVIFFPLTAFWTYAQIDKRAKLVSSAGSLAAIISLLIKLLFVYFKLPLIYFTFMAGFDLIIGSLIVATFFLSTKYWRSLLLKPYDFKFKEVFKYMYELKYSIIFSVSFQMLLRIDQLLLPRLTNAYTLGIYTPAVKISEVPNVIAGVIYVTLLSRVAPLILSNKEEDKVKVKKVFWVYFLAGSSAAIFIILVAPYAIAILYGSAFVESVPVLRTYALSIPFMFLCFYYNSIYGALNRKKVLAFVFLLAALSNIVLVVSLTPIYGLIGTSLANVITYFGAVATFALYKHFKNI